MKDWRTNMSIPSQKANELISTINNSGRIQNLFAQSHAKFVLYEVKESPDNFPAFDTKLEDKVTYSAYALLAASCSLLEKGSTGDAYLGIETAAAILQNAHKPHSINNPESSFHVLISAMAFYTSGHYSRAFVTLKQIESLTPVAGMIAAFIRKEPSSLIKRINMVLLNEREEFSDQADLDDWVISTAIARALALLSEYLVDGNEEYVSRANEIVLFRI